MCEYYECIVLNDTNIYFPFEVYIHIYSDFSILETGYIFVYLYIRSA